MKALILVDDYQAGADSNSQKNPICLVSVASKPVLEYSIECCEASQIITEIIILTYHHIDQFKAYCEQRKKTKPLVCIKETQPLGTAGALHNIEFDTSQTCLIMDGANVCRVDIDAFIHWHQQKQALMSVLIQPNDHPYDSDLVWCDKNDRVISVIPKPHPQNEYFPNCVNTGCYIINTQLKSHIPKNQKSDFRTHILPKVCKTDAVYGYYTSAYVQNIKIADRMKQIENDVLAGKLFAYKESQPRPTVFLDRDGVINEDSSYIKTDEEFILYSFAAKAIKQLNRAGFLVIVVTNQSVIACGLCSEEMLKKIHNKMETLLGRQGAYVDKIYYCPHHPDKHVSKEATTLKVECSCRKPKPGMILQATKDVAIDLSQSFLIGDSERDIQSAHAAGVTAIGVKTGNAVQGKTKPEYICKNLEDAVELILSLLNK